MNKPKSSKLFFWSKVVSIGAIIVVLSFTLYGLYLAKKVNNMQQQWLEYNQQFTQISISLQELHDALGYGGLIHDFKNYVLRLNPKYEQRTQASFDNSWQALSYLEKHLSLTDSIKDTQEITWKG